MSCDALCAVGWEVGWVWAVGLGTGLTVSQRRRVAAVSPAPSNRLLFLAVCNGL